MYALALDDSRLIETWDRAAPLERPWRELTLLESASGIPLDELARLSIGERDRLLLALRIGMFGARLDCETRCPACHTRLELSVDATALMIPPRAIEPHELELVEDDWMVRFRLPDSSDVAACANGADHTLVERCVEVVAMPGASRERNLPAAVRTRVAERMSALDPQADLSFDLCCAACGNRWQSPFDAASFLMHEVDAQVGRLTAEVHQLARAYGWSEQSILAMGRARRRRYLSLLLQ